MIDIRGLNANQKEAVLSKEKYLRIVAGAGSGKTRVLTMRIAHLVEEENIAPYKVLAITFTNKAANEMKERVNQMMDPDKGVPWISTIHSLCVRILRADIQTLGWPKNFTIMDSDDQRSVLKEAYKDFNIDAQDYPYGMMLDYISNNKSAEISVERAYQLAGSYTADKTKAKVYEYYVTRQNTLYALDFDDLIIQVVKMFRKFPEVLNKWQNRFSYILVDEFQDIDTIQYKLIRQLAGINNSLYVVGDPDQTIYSWRGADVNIIMNFENDFKPCKTIFLNENYRSTSCILNAANCVIQNNKHRLEKDLFTNRQSNELVTHYASASDEYEADWIAATVKKLHAKGKSYHDIAILYRSNYLSRSLEKSFRIQQIPYVIYGGLRFYERQEVKDAICYLRMVTSADDLALQRILNRPKRGIGNKTMDTINETARHEGISMYEVIKMKPDLFSGKTKTNLQGFVTMVERWRTIYENHEMEFFRLFEKIIEDSGYKMMLEEDKEVERLENIKELVDDVKEFTENNPEATLDEYLQEVSLYTDREETLATNDFVQMMTVHAAKGLEFDTVFITDMNDGIFPNERAMNEGGRGVEEERRLAYVAFTRAKNKLYITEAGGYSYILQKVRTKSRFINEIDEAYIEHVGAIHEQQAKHSAMLEKGMFEDAHTPIQDRMAIQSTNLKKGEAVVHDKFGEGIVIKCKNGIAEIAFPYPYGVKKIMAGHASLHKKSDLKS